MRVGARGAVPAGVEVHQVGVDLRQLLVADARSLRGAGAHAVQQQVGPGRQLAHDLLALRRLEVHADVLGTGHGAVHRHRHALAAPVASGRLDANYPRAQLGDQRAAQWPVDHRAQVQQGYSFQSMFRHRRLFAVGTTLNAAAQLRQRLRRVLAQRWSRPRRAARRPAHVNHGTKLPRRAHARHVRVLHVAVVHDLGMVQRPLGGVVRLGGNVAGLAEEYVHPLGQCLLLDLLQHDPFQRRDSLLTQEGSILEPGVLVDEVHVEPVHHGPEQPFHHVAQLNPLAVFGAGGQVACGIGPADAHPGVWRVGIGQVLDHLAVHPRNVVVGGDGLEHAGLHPLAQAGLFAHVQGRGDAADQRRGGGMADSLNDHVVRAFPRILLGEHHHPPALGGDNPVVALVVSVGPVGSEAGQRGIHQPGMAVPQAVVVDAQPLGDARPKILDHHVRELCQLPCTVLSVLGFQVQDDALLAPVPLD